MVLDQDKGIVLALVVLRLLGPNGNSGEEEGLLKMWWMVDQKELLEEYHDSASFGLDMEDGDFHILVETSQAYCCTYHEHLMKVVVLVHLADRQEDP